MWVARGSRGGCQHPPCVEPAVDLASARWSLGDRERYLAEQCTIRTTAGAASGDNGAVSVAYSAYAARAGLEALKQGGDAVREGYGFNLAERTVAGTAAVAPLVEVDHAGVVIEAVKLADDGSADVIVRLYESLGGRAKTTLRAGSPWPPPP